MQDLPHDYAECYDQVSSVRDQKYAEIMKKKGIIGCTTTAAAKKLLDARPGIVLVEAAGEIFESHSLAAVRLTGWQTELLGQPMASL